MVGVLNNPKKQALFPIDERVALIRASVASLGAHVAVEAFDGLTVDFARRHDATFIVRGLRAVSDFEAELQMAHTNRKLAPEIDTTFLMTRAGVRLPLAHRWPRRSRCSAATSRGWCPIRSGPRCASGSRPADGRRPGERGRCESGDGMIRSTRATRE